MAVWTIATGHDWTVPSTSLTQQKWKHLEINRKCRQDSPPEFKAVINYSSDITFNDRVEIYRDGKIEWKGFIEDIEATWDKDGRYLNIGGRDITLLLWRKYVENFNNPINKNQGFFGNVSAAELVKFLLRTPRSDLPVSENDNKLAFPFNKEGWGLDPTRFTTLSATNTAYGDINYAILRQNGLSWRNSGDPYAGFDLEADVITYCQWDTAGTYPYVNQLPFHNGNYVHSRTGNNYQIIFSFQNMDETYKSINDCMLHIEFFPDNSAFWWVQSDINIEIWVASLNSWIEIGDFGGKSGSIFGIINFGSWVAVEFDLRNFVQTTQDVNALQVRFTETGSLGSKIDRIWLSVGATANQAQYASPSGSYDTDIVNIGFNCDPEEIMGLYLECRDDPSQYPRNYKVTTLGDQEYYTNYTKIDPNNHITIESSKIVADFDSWDNETAYLYLDEGVGGIMDIDESFSFEVDTSQAHPYAFIPFCLANTLTDFKTLINTPNINLTAIVVENSANVLYLHFWSIINGVATVQTLNNITFTQKYYIHVIRTSSSLEYRVYVDPSLAKQYQIGSNYTFTNSTAFQYRFQAISYNGYEWAKVFEHNMDTDYTSGEQVVNGGFETDDWTGWSHDVSGCSIEGTYVHSGNYAAELDCTSSQQNTWIYQIFSEDISKAYLSSFSLWYMLRKSIGFAGTGPLEFVIILYYSDSSSDSINITPIYDEEWHEVDLSAIWNASKLLHKIYIMPNPTSGGSPLCNITAGTAMFYFDDVSLTLTLPSSWSRKGGTATRSTDTTHEIEGSGCQKINAISDGQEYYFEENIPTSDFVKVEGYIRIPATPTAEGIDQDYLPNAMTIDYAQGPHTWGCVGTSPYLNDSGHNSYCASDDVTTGEFANIWTFQQLDSKFRSLELDTGGDCTLKLDGKLWSDPSTGNHPTSVTLEIKIWEQHQNNGSGAYVTVGYYTVTTTSWTTATFTHLESYLMSLVDWQNAKLRVNVYSISGGGTGGGVCISYARLHCKGVGYSGYIYLMKLYNNAYAGGPNPSSNYQVAISAQPDPSAVGAIAEQWKWSITADGYGNSLSSSAITTDTWYRIRVYFKKGAGDGYAKLYDITSGTEIFLCEITGIDNTSFGSIDRYTFEGEFSTYNDGIVYLDLTSVFTEGISCTSGKIYLGNGPDILLVDTWAATPNLTTLADDVIVFKNSSNLTINANSGDSSVTVADVSSFWAGEECIIYDENTPNGEVIDIDHISGNIIYLTGTLLNSYTIAAYAAVEGPNTIDVDQIVVTSVSGFTVGCPVEIYDDARFEINFISAIDVGTNTIALSNSLANNYLVSRNAKITGPVNVYPDIIHSWKPRKMKNIKITITADNARHGWEITQLYVYKTDSKKYRVTLDGADPLHEQTCIFNSLNYVDCTDTDIGKEVYWGSTDVGTLDSFNNDELEWHIATTITIPSGTTLTIQNGSGSGTLASISVISYSGGPYATIGDELDPEGTGETYFSYQNPIQQLNIPKNRLSDVLWDLCVYIEDEYYPYEWWIEYDLTNTFHITLPCQLDVNLSGINNHGADKSATICFATGANIPPSTSYSAVGGLQGVKYQRTSRDLFQRCQIIGQGEGKTQYDSSSFWATDDDAMDEVNGFMENIVTQKQISNIKLANRYAKVKLKLDASPKRKNEILATISKDIFPTFDYTNPKNIDTYNVGDYIYVYDVFVSSVRGKFRIYDIKKIIEATGENVILTIQAPYKDIGNVYAEIWKQLKAIGIVGTIAQDWAAIGQDVGKVNSDKLSDLFTVTGKNEDTTAAVFPTTPQWWKGWNGNQNGQTQGADFTGDVNSNITIWGAKNSGEDGDVECEARYKQQSNQPYDANLLLIPVVVTLTQNPKFTCEFKIWEPMEHSPNIWNEGDLVEFGMYHTNTPNSAETTDTTIIDNDLYSLYPYYGFFFRVQKESDGFFYVYAVFRNGQKSDGTYIEQTKKICRLESSTSTTDIKKYKGEIIVKTATNAYGINTVTFNIYNQQVDDPSATKVSAVFMNISNWYNFATSPIYLHAHGNTGGSNYRCIMQFYSLKCQRDVI